MIKRIYVLNGCLLWKLYDIELFVVYNLVFLRKMLEIFVCVVGFKKWNIDGSFIVFVIYFCLVCLLYFDVVMVWIIDFFIVNWKVNLRYYLLINRDYW